MQPIDNNDTIGMESLIVIYSQEDWACEIPFGWFYSNRLVQKWHEKAYAKHDRDVICNFETAITLK